MSREKSEPGSCISASSPAERRQSRSCRAPSSRRDVLYVQYPPPCAAPGRHRTPNSDVTEGSHALVEDLLFPLFSKPPAAILPSSVTSGGHTDEVSAPERIPVLSCPSRHILAACPLSRENLQVQLLLRTNCVYHQHVTELRTSRDFRERWCRALILHLGHGFREAA